jgi:dipeptidyl aminopeptidase/acylaminoacyl peptidase
VLQARGDVERRRIAIVGWSFCGISVAQAASHDRRLAAVVVDPGVNNIVSPYQLGPLVPLADAGDKQQVNASWANHLAHSSAADRFTIAKRSEIYAQPSFYDQIRYMQKFNISPSTIGRIKAPTLVMQAQDEQFYPGQSLEVYSQLRARKRLAKFTVSQGAQYHDEPMAPQMRNEVLYGWLDGTLGL